MGILILITAMFSLLMIIVSERISNKEERTTPFTYKSRYGDLKYGELQPPIKYDKYYRELPCKGDLSYFFWICIVYKIIDEPEEIIPALILKWIDEEKVKLVNKTNDLKFNFKEMKEFKNPFECSLFMMLYAHSENNILTQEGLQYWYLSNMPVIKDWIDDYMEYQTGKLVEKGLLVQTKYTNKKRKVDTYILSENIEKEALHIIGLKNYIEEFTLISEKHTLEVHLFNQYMEFAVLFKLTTNVYKQIEELSLNMPIDINLKNVVKNSEQIANYFSKNI